MEKLKKILDNCSKNGEWVLITPSGKYYKGKNPLALVMHANPSVEALSVQKPSVKTNNV